MVTDKGIAATSYGGGVFSIISALTLTDWGILVGIITALGTFALQTWWVFDKRKRAVEIHQLAIRGAIDRRDQE